MSVTAYLSASMVAAFAASIPAPDASIPNYAYETAAEVGLAVGVAPFCQNIETKEDAVTARLFGLWERLISDGYDVAAVQIHLESSEGNRHIEAWLRDFQHRHGAADANLVQNCVAMRAEAAENPSLGALIQLH